MVWPRPTSTAQDTLMVLAAVAVSLHRAVMLMGRGGRLGSAPGLLVGIGLGRGQSFWLTWTQE